MIAKPLGKALLSGQERRYDDVRVAVHDREDPMPSVAQQLRQAREQQKLTIYDVAEATKIRTDHVRALEDGTYDIFAAPVYIRGFVRTYATMLKLDAPQLLRELEAELSSIARFSQPPNLAEKSPGAIDLLMLQLSKMNWQLLVLVLGTALVLTLAMVSYRAWRIHQTADPLAGLRPVLYQLPGTNSGELLALPAAPPPH